ncbi:MAG TPA: class I SAM-dependent methyltransferase [Caulobacteraceae bacterium]|jgi:SAM-dependent methyltransferase|nr:class I SAM-dependent methyltransferase [Caulobacteraceae bacterium]
MVADSRLSRWTRDAAAPFEGWDFSYLDGRMIEAEPPWSYPALAKAAVQRAHDILDVATGGGEVFASLAPFPGRASAVEGYVPNLAVARRRLEPLGVAVFQGNTASGMPFEDASFDLVLNRHGGFRPAEMHRILKPGGVFLTQQVAGDNLADLSDAFAAKPMYPDHTLKNIGEELRALGFTLGRTEAWRGPITFLDVGAIVYFLKAIPWVVEGFSVERHLGALEALHARSESTGPLRFTYTRFLIEAVKG